MSNGEHVQVVLLSIPGYTHRAKYAKKWEQRIGTPQDDPTRLISGRRYILPVLAGEVVPNEKNRAKGLEAEPAIIGISFGRRGSSTWEAINSFLTLLGNPRQERCQWRTFRLSDVQDSDNIGVISVTINIDAAEQFVAWLREETLSPPPTNFRTKATLTETIFGTPEDILRAVGLEHLLTPNPVPDPEDDEWEDGFDEDDSGNGPPWPDREVDDFRRRGFEEIEDDDDEEEDDEDEEDTEREVQRASRDEQLPKSPAPSTVSSLDSDANAVASLKKGDFPIEYRPSPRATARLQQSAEEPTVDDFAFLKKMAPTRVHAVLGAAAGLLSMVVPQFGLLMFPLIGRKWGLRMALGGLLMSLPYYLTTVVRLPFFQWYWLHLLLVMTALFFFFWGVKGLYRMYQLRFELSKVTKHGAAQLKRMAKPPATAAQLSGAPGVSSVSVSDLQGSVTDLLFLILPLLFLYPPLTPIAVALLLYCWDMERKFLSLWHWLVIPGVIIPTATSETRWLLVAMVCMSVAYISPRSQMDITEEQIRSWPSEGRRWWMVFRSSPLTALAVLWRGKKAMKVPATYHLPKVDEPVRNTILGLGGENISKIVSILSPIEYDALMRAYDPENNLPLPIGAQRLQEAKFYNLTYRFRPIQPEGIQLVEGADAELVAKVMTSLISRGYRTMGMEPVVDIPAVCRVSPDENQGCLPKEFMPPFVDNNTVIVPIGLSYHYYLDEGGKHRHYVQAWPFAPKQAGHALIVAATGGGKSVLVRALLNGLMAASTQYPVRILYSEGKTEIASPNRLSPMIAPPMALESGGDVLRFMSAALSIIETRQLAHRLLCELRGQTLMPAEVFKKYGGLPLLAIVLDEYLSARLKSQQVKDLQVKTPDGVLRASADQFFNAALARILAVSRSLFAAMILTTQTMKRETLGSPVIKDNCTIVVGSMKSVNPSLLSAVIPHADLKGQEAIAMQILGTKSPLPGRYGFLFSSGPAALPVFVRSDRTYVMSGQTEGFTAEPPTWAVFIPYYYPSLIDVEPSQMAHFDLQTLLADLDQATKRSPSRVQVPSVGWAKALGIEPFDSVEGFLDFGAETLTDNILRQRETLAIRE